MASTFRGGNRVILVLLPVCAYSGRNIGDQKMKASVLTEQGDVIPGIRLLRKQSGFLVFVGNEAMPSSGIRVYLEISGYLPGSFYFQPEGDTQPIREHRVRLYPTRNRFTGMQYTAICGHAPAGNRIMAYSADDKTGYRLTKDVAKGTGTITLFTGNDTAEGKILAATDEDGKLLDILEIADIPLSANEYALKTPAAAKLTGFSTDFYLIEETETAPDETYFLPVHCADKEKCVFKLITTKKKRRKITEIEMIPGKENYLDL